MSRTAEDIIEEVLAREGDKYTNYPEDRGGPTKYGITQATLSQWRRRPVTPDEVAALTKDEARTIYYAEFIVSPGFLRIRDDDLRAICVDAGVNHGPRHAIKWLQAAASDEVAGIRLAQDGVLGPKTEAAVNAADPMELFLWVCAHRIRLYGRLVRADIGQAKFIAGWNNRVAEFIEDAARRLEREHRRSAG